MTFPTIARVRRSYHQNELSDVSAATVAAIRGSRVGGRLKPAGRIAITVGSRGIAEIARIVRLRPLRNGSARLGVRPLSSWPRWEATAAAPPSGNGAS